MSKTEIAVRDKPGELTGPASEPNLLTVIAAAVADPRIDVEKMERLLAMHEKITTEQRRIDFFAALARIQAVIPQIDQKGMIHDKQGNLRSRYAKIEHIDAILRPLLSEEGFAMSFDSEAAPNGGYLLSCTLEPQGGTFGGQIIGAAAGQEPISLRRPVGRLDYFIRQAHAQENALGHNRGP